jgi:hypothetical protein
VEKLLPCPVCGRQPNLSSLEPEHKSMKYFCSVHISCGDWKDTNELAIVDWNRRVKEYEGLVQSAHKNEMYEYIKSAIHYLELAQNVVECDDKFNDGQSEELNEIYDKVAEAIKLIENI